MLSSWLRRTPKLLICAGLLAVAFGMFATSTPKITANATTDYYPGPCTKAPSNVTLHYVGATSGCSDTNNKPCTQGELIEFNATTPSGFQTCDVFTWIFGDDPSHPLTTLRPTLTRVFSGTSPRLARLRVGNDQFSPAGISGGTVNVAPPTAGSCTPNANTLCFVSNRYMVTLNAIDVGPPRSNDVAVGEANTQTPDTGYFTLSGLTHSTSNPEVVVKVLPNPFDGTQPAWVFFGGLTDVEYFVNVVDTQTGQVRQYHKFPFTVQNGFDTGSGQLPTPEVVAGSICPPTPQATTTTEAPSTCTPNTTTLCLLGNRFKVTLNATNRNAGPTNGQQAPGITLPKSDLFGFFSIPGLTNNPNNLEVFVKALDGRGINGKYWVFFGTLTNFELNVTVTDTQTGQKKTYFRPGSGDASACGAADTAAFPF